MTFEYYRGRGRARLRKKNWKKGRGSVSRLPFIDRIMRWFRGLSF